MSDGRPRSSRAAGAPPDLARGPSPAPPVAAAPPGALLDGLREVGRAMSAAEDLAACLRRAVEAIPRVLRRPERAWARIHVGAHEAATPGAPEAGRGIEVPLRAGDETLGVLEVGHLDGSGELPAASPAVGDEERAALENEERARLEIVAQQVVLGVRRNRAESELRRRDEQLALAIDGLRGGIWDLRFDPDRPGEMPDRCYLSDSLKRLIGFEPDELPSSRLAWWERVHPEDVPRLDRTAEDHIAGRTELHDVEYRIRHRDGSFRWLHTRGRIRRDEAGRPVRWTGLEWDVTAAREADSARRRSEERLRDLALRDPLTELPNRALAEHRLAEAIAAAAEGSRVGVLFIDLDEFKIINDSLGHRAGDQLLVQVAGRFHTCMRESDFLARFGGDEFLVVLEDLASPEAAVQVAERLQACLVEPFEVAGTAVHQAASIGVAVGGDGRATVEELLRYADVAMYRAKRSTHRSVELFQGSVSAPEIRRLQEENELRAALERGQFELHYQPIVDLERHVVRGAEALVRWRHPQRGLLPPADFIPLAEETGLIVPIGDWVIAEAVRQVCRWRRQGGVDETFELSVNLSARQLEATDFVQRVQRLLTVSGFPPHQLLLELTENVLLRSTVRARDLRDLGVRLAIDDFGTGYASLAYLRQMIVDTLKIDRSFTRDLDTDPTCLRLVRSVFFLAESLDLNVIVEGIERLDQEDMVTRMGGSLVQGFLYSRPLPAEEFLDRGMPCAA